MQEKILILGGSHFQIPVIKYAKSAGYYVVTCDYLPDNPGHKYADEYHNVSTTDQEAVLELARQLKIDGILAYASDPAALTGAYVGNEMGLPSNQYESVQVLSNKDMYRSFLRSEGFNTPIAFHYSSLSELNRNISRLRFPVMVKPVDSSGSKGISKVDSSKNLPSAVERAMQFSRAQKVIIEEFLVREGPQIGGEAFVLDGRLVFMCLGDQVVDLRCNPYVPAGMTFPSMISTEIYNAIAYELQRLIDNLHFTFGGLNLEIMRDGGGKLYLMEVASRTGGNFLPELMYYCAGFNSAKYSVESVLGHAIVEKNLKPSNRKDKYFAYYALHSLKSGILDSIHIDPGLESNILEMYQFKHSRDKIEVYNDSTATLGILLLIFSTHKEMQEKMTHMQDYVKLNMA